MRTLLVTVTAVVGLVGTAAASWLDTIMTWSWLALWVLQDTGLGSWW